MDQPPSAIDVFSLELIKPPRWRFLAAVLLNVIGQTMNAESGGGSRAIFRRRSSDELVGEFTQAFIGDGANEFTIVLSDYSRMRADEFERIWLQPRTIQPRS